MGIKINKLKANPDNPRNIRDWRFEKLKESLQQFPTMLEMRPIIVDEQWIILAGNMRVEALKALGHKTIPDEWVKKYDTLTQDEKDRLAIQDNAHYGEWDMDTLANNWSADLLRDWGVDIPDWSTPKDPPAAGDNANDQAATTGSSRRSPTDPLAGAPQDPRYAVIIHCDDEEHQGNVFRLLQQQGFNVQSHTS